MIKVICRVCQSQFKVKDNAESPVKCTICESPNKLPATDKPKKTGDAAGTKCLVCGKRLAANVKFCSACGTSSVDAGDHQVAEWKLNQKLENRLFFYRWLPWWLRGWLR